MPSPSALTETQVKRPLAALAYDTIYRNIITLVYEPGQHLEESQLVDQLGIGRTPIREGLQRLAADLLVESQPGKGYVVRPLTIQNTKAAFAALRIMGIGSRQSGRAPGYDSDGGGDGGGQPGHCQGGEEEGHFGTR